MADSATGAADGTRAKRARGGDGRGGDGRKPAATDDALDAFFGGLERRV